MKNVFLFQNIVGAEYIVCTHWQNIVGAVHCTHGSYDTIGCIKQQPKFNFVTVSKAYLKIT